MIACLFARVFECLLVPFGLCVVWLVYLFASLLACVYACLFA